MCVERLRVKQPLLCVSFVCKVPQKWVMQGKRQNASDQRFLQVKKNYSDLFYSSNSV